MDKLADEVIATLTGGNDDARKALVRAIEQRSGYTLRDATAEGAVRQLANLMDVESWRAGFGDGATLEAPDSWRMSAQLRQEARLPLTLQDLANYLSDAHINHSTSSEDGFEIIHVPPGNDQGWPPGYAAVFYTSQGPHLGIGATLAALEINSVTTQHKARRATLGFLSTSPFVEPEASGAPLVDVRSWDNRDE